MPDKISIEKFLDLSPGKTIIDVRSPSEYSAGHIPDSINIPLFNDQERKEVGTLYKNKGKQEAIRAGFEILASKFTRLRAHFLQFSESREIFLYCWRGGMRSASLAWLLERSGFRVFLLSGGYRSYRKLVRSYFSSKLNLLILGGKTGTGKTEILKHLKTAGEQIVDLEAIARHKGSAYGALGEKQQPTTEQFENLLLREFLKLDRSKIIWLENESQAIGKVFIPRELYLQMQESNLIHLEVPLEIRVQRLVKDYSRYSDKDLLECTGKIAKKLGGQNFKKVHSFIASGNYTGVARLALGYYDKTYTYGMEKRAHKKITTLISNSGSAQSNSVLIRNKIRNTFLN